MTVAARLKVEGVAKRFAAVQACADVDLEIAAGEIHALLGENGAGKSTLVKVIYGALAPDAGEMRLDGEPYAPRSPAAARGRGVGLVFQHFSLFEGLSVLENIALALPGARPGPRIAAKVEALAQRYGIEVAPARPVATLSVGERQRVEVLRALIEEPRLLILDEPTSVLTPQEVEALFVTLRQLAGEGRSVLYISHKLEEVRRLCDRATVMRQGRVVATCRPAEETTRSLAEMMLGQALASPARHDRRIGAPRLVVDRATVSSGEAGAMPLAPVSIEVRAGEIVGIAGIAGNGQSELMALLTGETLADDDAAITLDGRPLGHAGIVARRAAGLAFVPEERLGRAAIAEFNLIDNAMLTGLVPPKRLGLIDRAAGRAAAERIVAECDVRTAGVEHPAMTLSGGNLQKFVVGRALAEDPRAIVVAQPTWGVDANAQAAIHDRLRALAARGAAVLVISQDLDELMGLSDRIAVIAAGHLSAARPTQDLTVEEIGLAMAAPADDALGRRVAGASAA